MPEPSPLSVWLNSYQQPLKAALSSAVGDGFSRVQINAAAERELQEFSRTAQRHFARHTESLGIELDALAATHGGLGLADAAHADDRIHDLTRTLELCAALGVKRATATIGGFADEKSRPLAEETLRIAAELAGNFDVTLAVQTGEGDIAALAERLQQLRCPNLGVAVDSVQRLSGAGAALRGRVEAAYLRDARRVGGQFEEAAFGRGDVDFARFFGDLADWEYKRTFTLRRHDLRGAVDSLRAGREYLERMLRRGG